MITLRSLLKVVYSIDRAVSVLIVIMFVIVLFVGAYFTADAAYVFSHASGNKIAAYRPVVTGDGQEVQSEEVTMPFTKDYVGWITVNGTTLDYPVMQGETNSTYLNTDPYGEYSLAGSIFLDCRNASDFSDDYSILYGHHMAGGYMFGCLDDYFSEEFFEGHRDGTLIVDGVAYPVKAFAVLATDAVVSTVFNPKPTDDVVAYAKQTAVFYRDDTEGRVLALSTCSNPSNTERTVVLFRISEVVMDACE